MSRYQQARKDFETLEAIAELTDSVALSDNLFEFMQNPTKDFAAGLYESGIQLWFRGRRHRRAAQH